MSFAENLSSPNPGSWRRVGIVAKLATFTSAASSIAGISGITPCLADGVGTSDATKGVISSDTPFGASPQATCAHHGAPDAAETARAMNAILADLSAFLRSESSPESGPVWGTPEAVQCLPICQTLSPLESLHNMQTLGGARG